MKEVLTKGFWQGVKKTFYEALEDPQPKSDSSQVPAEGKPNPPAPSGSPAPSPPESNQN